MTIFFRFTSITFSSISQTLAHYSFLRFFFLASHPGHLLFLSSSSQSNIFSFRRFTFIKVRACAYSPLSYRARLWSRVCIYFFQFFFSNEQFHLILFFFILYFAWDGAGPLCPSSRRLRAYLEASLIEPIVEENGRILTPRELFNDR